MRERVSFTGYLEGRKSWWKYVMEGDIFKRADKALPLSMWSRHSDDRRPDAEANTSAAVGDDDGLEPQEEALLNNEDQPVPQAIIGTNEQLRAAESIGLTVTTVDVTSYNPALFTNAGRPLRREESGIATASTLYHPSDEQIA